MASQLNSVPLIFVQTTIDSKESADQMARALVDSKVAACVQVDGPIQSHYRWDGKVESSQEYRLTIKTLPEMWPALETKIRSLHSYATPEIISLEVTRASEGYIDWARGSVA